MAAEQTKNYGLNQWQAGDQVLREEFNQDNSRVDRALAGLDAVMTAGLERKYGTDNPVLTQGDYIGTGELTIAVESGFRPSLVMIFALWSDGSYDYIYLVGDQAAQMLETQFNSRQVRTDALQFTQTGFVVNYQPGPSTKGFNVQDRDYHYVVFR